MIDGLSVGEDIRAIVQAWPGPACLIAPGSSSAHPRLLLWNDPFTRWLGTPGSSGELGLAALAGVTATDRSTLLDLLADVERPRAGVEPASLRLAAPDHDGEFGSREVRLRARRFELGSGACVLMEDAEIETQLKDRVRDLENASVVGAFAHGVVHSIRNQLTVVMGSSFALKRTLEKSDPAIAESIADILEKVAEGVASASKQIQAFADFGSPVPDLAPAELSSLLTDAVRPLVDNAFIKARVDLEWEFLDEPVTVEGSRNTVGAILLRVLRVYLAELPAGSTLRTALARDADHLCVSFRASRSTSDDGSTKVAFEEPAAAWAGLGELASEFGVGLEVSSSRDLPSVDVRLNILR